MLLHAQFGLNISSDILDIGANVYGQFLLKMNVYPPSCPTTLMASWILSRWEPRGSVAVSADPAVLSDGTVASSDQVPGVLFATFLDCCRGIGSQLLVLAKLFIELVLQFLELVLVFLLASLS